MKIVFSGSIIGRLSLRIFMSFIVLNIESAVTFVGYSLRYLRA